MSLNSNIEPPDSSQKGELTADEEKTNNEYTTSSEKPIPKQPLVMIDYLSASYLSHRSSSVETLESPTLGDECTNFNPEVDNPHAINNDDSSTDSTEEGKVSRIMIHSMEIMPDHQSTPNAEYQYMSSVAEGDNVLRKELSFNEGEDAAEEELLMPGDLAVPIMGYETMESRSRFTVYKIKVQKRDDPVGWFVFRRYSDFVHLNERLKHLFPGFRLSLPPKRWFRDNYDKNFLEDRVLGLQAFLNNITGHKDICNSLPVRGFLCIDDPPGPHDSLEESRALCETLEETLYTLRQDLQDKDSEINLLKEELQLYKSQVEMLSSRLREVTDSVMKGESILSQSSTSHSLAECDHHDAVPVPTQAGDNLSQNS